MGSLKRRSLQSFEEPANAIAVANGEGQENLGEQLPFPEPMSTATTNSWEPLIQHDFPATDAIPVASERKTDPGVYSEEFERLAAKVAPTANGPVTPLPDSAGAQDTPLPATILPSLSAPMPQLAQSPVRKQVVIPAPRRRATKTTPISPLKRRILVNATLATMLVAVLGVALASTVAAHDGKTGGIKQIFSPIVNLFSAHNNNAAKVVSQAATPTPTPIPEIIQEDPQTSQQDVLPGNSGPTNATGSNGAADSGGLYRFAYGYCTYWANMHYHDLTGHWVPWLGNAYEWAYQAGAYGWVVSDRPNPKGPSIIVLMPDVYSSGPLGHVAVVESINPDGSVVTSNWNWASPWATTVYVTFQPGPGVKFVWYPG